MGCDEGDGGVQLAGAGVAAQIGRRPAAADHARRRFSGASHLHVSQPGDVEAEPAVELVGVGLPGEVRLAGFRVGLPPCGDRVAEREVVLVRPGRRGTRRCGHAEDQQQDERQHHEDASGTHGVPPFDRGSRRHGRPCRLQGHQPLMRFEWHYTRHGFGARGATNPHPGRCATPGLRGVPEALGCGRARAVGREHGGRCCVEATSPGGPGGLPGVSGRPAGVGGAALRPARGQGLVVDPPGRRGPPVRGVVGRGSARPLQACFLRHRRGVRGTSTRSPT